MAKSTRSKVKRSFRAKKRTEGVYAVAEAARLHRLNMKLKVLTTTDKDGDVEVEDAEGDDEREDEENEENQKGGFGGLVGSEVEDEAIFAWLGVMEQSEVAAESMRMLWKMASPGGRIECNGEGLKEAFGHSGTLDHLFSGSPRESRTEC